MHAIDLTRRAFRNLWQSKSRTILTASAIGIGAFSLAATIALGTSLDKLTKQLISQNTANIDISVSVYVEENTNASRQNPDPKEFDPTKRTSEMGAFGPPPQLVAKDIEDIKAVPGVADVDRQADSNVPARYITSGGKKYEMSGVRRFNPDDKPSFVGAAVSELKDGQIVIQRQYLSLLGIENEAAAIGKQITIGLELPDLTYSEQPFTIAAVSEKPNSLFSIFSLNTVFVSRADVDRLYDIANKGSVDYNKFYSVTVKVADGATPATVQQAIASLGNGKRFTATDLTTFGDDAGKVIRNIQAALAGFAALVLFAALFGVINTQLMSVLQRTREIGLMKALGMSSSAVSRLFLTEAALIGLLGGVFGTVAAWVTSRLVDPILRKQLADIISLDQLIYFNWAQIFYMLLGLMFIAALAGLLPARRAAKLDPIEALRTE